MPAYKNHFVPRLVVSGLFAVTPAFAQNPESIPRAESDVVAEDVEVEIEVEANDTGDAPPPSPAPAIPPEKPEELSTASPESPTTEAGGPSAATPAPVPAAESPKSPPAEQAASAKPPSANTATPEPGVSDALKLRLSTQSPVEASFVGESLEAEGSNYRRVLRPGFNLWGFVQVQIQGNQLSEDELDADGESLNQFTVGLRRARLRLDHGWKYAFATLELDASTVGGPAVRVRRAEASLLYRAGVEENITPPFILTAGVTDIPFGYELGQSQRDRLFMEQSLPSRAIFPTPADLGVKFWGAYHWAEYAVAVVNGETQGRWGVPEDQNSAKDLAIRVGASASPAKNIRLAGGTSAYVGKGFSPGQPATKDTIQWIDLNNNGVADSDEIQGFTGSSAISSANYSRYAIGADADLTVKFPIGPLKVGGELYVASNMDRGVLPNDPIITGADSQQFGASFYGVQGITQWFAVGVRAAFYDPNSNLLEQRSGTYHLRNQTFWELSPTIALTLDRARLSAAYDFIWDNLGRDASGVPTDVANNEWTLRLQVDL